MDDLPTVVLDVGTREWRCGWAHDEGPSECPPGVSAGDDAAWRAQLTSALEALEATPTECKVMLSERPGTSKAEREDAAKALFVEHGVPAVCIAAAPLLALFNFSRDTCVVVDVGKLSTFIFCVYEGHAILDAATVHSLAGAHLP
eukprot:4580617-Prymnesium_polylepis.1